MSNETTASEPLPEPAEAAATVAAVSEEPEARFQPDIEPERRATAVGVYNFITGVIYLPASLLAGALWALHPATVFMTAAGLSIAALAAFAALGPGRAMAP